MRSVVKHVMRRLMSLLAAIRGEPAIYHSVDIKGEAMVEQIALLSSVSNNHVRMLDHRYILNSLKGMS